MVFSELMVFSEVLDEQMEPMVFFEAHSPFEQKMIFVAAMAFVPLISLPLLGMNSLIVSFLLFHETAAAYSRSRDHHQDHLLNRNLLMTTIFSCQLNYFVIIVWAGSTLSVIDGIDQLIYYFETTVWAALFLPLVFEPMAVMMIQYAAFVHLLAPDTTFLSSVHDGRMILYVPMVAV